MASRLDRTGLLYAGMAYLLWGFFPLYWRLLSAAGAIEILAHRVLWSIVICFLALAIRKNLGAFQELIRDSKKALWLFTSASALTINWGIFIWAINHDHLTDSALGYYINPLVMILFGIIVYREKLSGLQWSAVGCGTIAVTILTFAYGSPPWIALSLAFSWGFYGLIKKHVQAGALESLTVETLLMAPIALGYLLFLNQNGVGKFGHNLWISLLFILGGFVTTIPLLLFNGAATRLPLSIIGLMQYLNPSVQFLTGLFLIGEIMTPARWWGFGFIWIALIFLGSDSVKTLRQNAQ